MKKIALMMCVSVFIITVVLSGCNEQQTGNTNTNEEAEQNIISPIITSFTVNPNQINKGETAELRWVVTDATSVSIDNGIGSVTLSGNRIISPTDTTVYVLTASSSSKQVTSSTQIIVINNDLQKLVGSWRKTSGVNVQWPDEISFNADKTGIEKWFDTDGSYSYFDFDFYYIDGPHLTIQTSTSGGQRTYTYVLQNGNTLELKFQYSSHEPFDTATFSKI